MNAIGKITFDFNMQDETFARDLYARWDNFFALNFEQVAAEVFSGRDLPGYTVQLEKLELDLGEFPENGFYEAFPLRLKEKLDEALAMHIFREQPQITGMKKRTDAACLFEILAGFLLHGTLAWNVPGEYKNIPYLFRTVLQQESVRLRQFLQTYGHYTSLRERLVHQLNDPELERGVYLLQPSGPEFICSYVRFLHAGYKEIRRPGLEKYAYHRVVWLVVYAYLLHNQGSYFNKKRFLAQTILHLAAANQLAYESLLEMLTRNLEIFAGNLVISPELLHLLGELKKEVSAKRPAFTASYLAEVSDLISGLLRERAGKGIAPAMREEMIRILSRPDTCRLFLQPMSETEIIALVPVIALRESDFVIATARSFDRQRERGGLQGKTGGEFRLLKWQIIFPLLFANRGSFLNRKYFITSVLHQIASHYNLVPADIFAYLFTIRAYLALWDSELKSVIDALHRDEDGKKAKAADAREQKRDFPGAALKLLAAGAPELKYYELVKEFFPGEYEFIVQYAMNLDRYRERGGLEGRAGGEFRQVKWKFMFSVLTDMPGTAFHRRIFVEKTLCRIAAHYNMTYLGLLAWFRTEAAAIWLPFELQAILSGLFLAEKEVWIERVLGLSQEAEKYRLLEIIEPQEHLFVKDYVQVLERSHTGKLLQGKTSGEFRQLSWKFVFQVLLEGKHVAFNKKYFVRRTLTGLAAHYNLSLAELLVFFSSVTEETVMVQTRFKEICAIIGELYKEEGKSLAATSGKPGKTPAQLQAEKWFLEGADKLTARESLLLQKLLAGTNFLFRSSGLFFVISRMRRYFGEVFGIKINNRPLLDLLLQLSGEYANSGEKVWFSLLFGWAFRLLDLRQKEAFYLALTGWGEELAKAGSVSGAGTVDLNAWFSSLEEFREMKPVDNRSIPDRAGIPESDVGSVRFVENAGIVLLSPYLPRLFSLLALTDGAEFKDRECRMRALFLLQYLLTGNISVTETATVCFESPEYEMALNKLLVAWPASEALPAGMEITGKEISTLISMLRGALGNWPKLRNTSLEGFREAFLLRAGSLQEKGENYLLTVEEKAYDMLLDTVPWSFKMIKYPWMDKMIQVKWR